MGYSLAISSQVLLEEWESIRANGAVTPDVAIWQRLPFLPVTLQSLSNNASGFGLTDYAFTDMMQVGNHSRAFILSVSLNSPPIVWRQSCFVCCWHLHVSTEMTEPLCCCNSCTVTSAIHGCCSEIEASKRRYTVEIDAQYAGLGVVHALQGVR